MKYGPAGPAVVAHDIRYLGTVKNLARLNSILENYPRCMHQIAYLSWKIFYIINGEFI